MHAIIVGAGPAGLAAALALHQQSRESPSSPPIRVTVLEIRPNIETGSQLGGALILTPLALRYLDALGVGSKLRQLGCKVSGIRILSHRTGGSLGKLWPSVDTLSVSRHAIVECMARKVLEISDGPKIAIRYGVKIAKIEEIGNAVKVHLVKGGGEKEAIEADFLLGCDGIHSFVRSNFVDPAREKRYSRRGGAYGDVELDSAGDVVLSTPAGVPALRDCSMVLGGQGTLVAAYYEPSRTRVYLAAVLSDAEEKWKDEAKDGRKAAGSEKETLAKTLERDLLGRFSNARVAGLQNLVSKCDDWFFDPIFILEPGGVWSKGRVLLLGDAAHAMPPMGESTGVAIEDGVLLAHVFSRRAGRSVETMFADYEAVRRDAINKLYKDTMTRWGDGEDWSWMRTVAVDFAMWAILMLINWSSNGQFARDVRKIKLPS